MDEKTKKHLDFAGRPAIAVTAIVIGLTTLMSAAEGAFNGGSWVHFRWGILNGLMNGGLLGLALGAIVFLGAYLSNPKE